MDDGRKDELGKAALEYAEERDDVSPECAEAFAKLLGGILDIQDGKLKQDEVNDSKDGNEIDYDVYEDALEVQEPYCPRLTS